MHYNIFRQFLFGKMKLFLFQFQLLLFVPVNTILLLLLLLLCKFSFFKKFPSLLLLVCQSLLSLLLLLFQWKIIIRIASLVSNISTLLKDSSSLDVSSLGTIITTFLIYFCWTTYIYYGWHLKQQQCSYEEETNMLLCLGSILF